MGPKKKGKKAGRSSRGSGGIIDGVSIQEMSREQLEQFTLRIRDELEREREERNYFQLERDKLNIFWQITRDEQEERKAILRNKDRALEEAEERNQAVIKEFKEKVKHLMYEHNSHLTNLKAEGVVELKLTQEEYDNQKTLIEVEKKELKQQLIKDDMRFRDLIGDIKIKHSEEVNDLRSMFMKKIKEQFDNSEKRVNRVRNKLLLRNGVELSELEELKNKHISNLIKNQRQSLKDLSQYYKEITLHSYTTIDSLMDELVEIKGKEEEAQRLVSKLRQENKALREPMQSMQHTVFNLQQQLQHYTRDKTALMDMHKRAAKMNKQIEHLNFDNESLRLNLEKTEAEMDTLKTNYINSLVEIQQKNRVLLTALENRIAIMENQLETREVQIAHIVSKSNMDPEEVISACRKLEHMMSNKERRLEALRLELCRVARSHDEMLRLLQTKHKNLNPELPPPARPPLFPKLALRPDSAP